LEGHESIFKLGFQISSFKFRIIFGYRPKQNQSIFT